MTSYPEQDEPMEASYSEELVEMAFDAFFSMICYPLFGTTIETFSRKHAKWLDYDEVCEDEIAGFKPFYLQFRKPFMYEDSSSATIVRQRKKLSLNTHPRALFFDLHDLGNPASIEQHNLLYRLRSRLKRLMNSDAAYVCPLFVNRLEYRFTLFVSTLGIGLKTLPNQIIFAEPSKELPGKFESHVFIDVDASNKPYYTMEYHDVPFSAHHVCIPPHRLMERPEGCYSFSDAADDVCFHAQNAFSEEGVPLGKWLDQLSKQLDKEPLITAQNAGEKLKALVSAEDDAGPIPYPERLLKMEDGLAAWLEWGKFLRENYSIHQFFFVVWQ